MGVVASVEGLPMARKGVAGRAMSVLLAVALVATMTVLPSRQAHAATTTVKVPVTYGQTEARSMLNMVNSFRASSDAWYWNPDNKTKTVRSNLQPLAYDYALEQAAMLRAAEIAVSFDHARPNGTMCFTAGDELPLRSDICGENIAAGQGSAYAAYMDWREDNDKYLGQGHRRNMLDDFTSIGIGYVRHNGMSYWVQNFGYATPTAAATAPDNSTRSVAVDIDDALVTSKSMKLSPSALTLAVGGSAALPKATVEMRVMDNWPSGILRPDTSGVAWTSSKPSVAVISGGKVVAKSAGTATLTASLYGTKASVKVTVAALKTPKATSLKSVKSTGKKKIVVKWKKQTKNVSGYKVAYSTSKKFTKKTTVTKNVAKSKTSLTIKKLKSKKTYYVRICTYYKVGTAEKCSKWSKTLKVKVK